jgi:hypothetical protein
LARLNWRSAALVLGVLTACAAPAERDWRGPQNMTVPHFGERGPRPPPSVDPKDVLFWNRWADESIDPRAFMALQTELLQAHAASGSNGYLDSVLPQAAALYASPGAKHYLHVSPDRLLHELTIAGLPALVYENNQYITVRVAAVRQSGEADAQFIVRVMRAMLHFEPQWHFFTHAVADEQTRFSTEAGYRPNLDREAIGISGATVPSGLYFTKFRSMANDFDGRIPGTHPLLDDYLRAAWARGGGH